MKVQRFEDLIVWQKARELMKAIYPITQTGMFAKDFGLRDQLQRAVISVMSNIAEGFERNSAADFHHFLVISKASCAEVRSLLYAALDVGYLEEAQFHQLMERATETAKVIGGLKASVYRQK